MILETLLFVKILINVNHTALGRAIDRRKSQISEKCFGNFVSTTRNLQGVYGFFDPSRDWPIFSIREDITWSFDYDFKENLDLKKGKRMGLITANFIKMRFFKFMGSLEFYSFNDKANIINNKIRKISIPQKSSWFHQSGFHNHNVFFI